MSDFAIGLYQEYLGEASFLYEQRLALLKNPEIAWKDLDHFEERFEAHIDALVVGEDLALEICRTLAQQGDYGELHAAVRVFCRQQRRDLVWEVLERLDVEEVERGKAVCDALNHELPATWEPSVVELLFSGDPSLKALAAKMVGYRRIKATPVLLRALRQADASLSPTLIWALGRLREPEICQPLLDHVRLLEDEFIHRAAALALLRIGEPDILQYCLRSARSQTWPFLAIGLGGSRTASQILHDLVTNDQVMAEGLIALGLLGDVAAIEILTTNLALPTLAPSAAQALQLITGADLYEEVFIPEELDEATLFDEELERLERGAPLSPEGESPLGVTMSRLSQNPEEWRRWWQENRSLFSEQQRFRNGKPYSPACLLDNLTSEKSPRLIRQLAYEEMVIRYGVDNPFETDMPVAQQSQVLAKYADWIKANASRFREGEWYFAGQLMI